MDNDPLKPKSAVNKQLTLTGIGPKRKVGDMLNMGRGKMFTSSSNKNDTLHSDETSPSNPIEDEDGDTYEDGVEVRPLNESPPQRPLPVNRDKLKIDRQEMMRNAYSQWNLTRNPQHLDTLLSHLRPTIDQAVTSYAGSDSPLIRSRAKILAVDAINKYDPSHKARLDSWVMTNLQGLQRYRQKLSPIKTPQRVQIELQRLKQGEMQLYDELGRPPNMTELADHTSMSPKRIAHLRSFDVPVVAEGQMKDEEGAPYLPGTESHPWEEVWAEYVYHDLDDINKTIYDMSVGRNGYKPQGPTEIAKILKVSPAAVSQRAAKIAKMLEEGQKVQRQELSNQ